eukprot:s5326_g1.t1
MALARLAPMLLSNRGHGTVTTTGAHANGRSGRDSGTSVMVAVRGVGLTDDVLLCVNGVEPCTSDYWEVFNENENYVELVFRRSANSGSVDRSGWEMVANFFKLSPAYPPTGLYHNLLRLRWGAGAVFFLVLGRSDLLEALW